MKLLKIDSSARRISVSRRLTSKFAEAWQKEHPTGEVAERDLPATLLPHITDDWSATYADPSQATPAQQRYLLTSDVLIGELIAADTIVIGAPMYNFAVSWELKAWIDQVVRAGKTVAYEPTGPKGLLVGKKVVVITSRGGFYSAGSPRAHADFQEPYLRHVLGFMGLTDVTFIHAENQARREAETYRAAALERIAQVVSQTAGIAEHPSP